jgi:hypothetical protein
MSHRRSTRAYVVTALLCLAPLCFGQQPKAAPPTESAGLDETLAWLTQELNRSAGATYMVKVTSGPAQGESWTSKNGYRRFAHDKCALSYEQTRQKDDLRVRTIQFTIPLADVASASYRLDDGSEGTRFLYSSKIPELSIKTRTESIRWSRGSGPMPAGEADIQFGGDPRASQARIQRLAKAVMRAAALCAGDPAHAPAATKTPSAPAQK